MPIRNSRNPELESAMNASLKAYAAGSSRFFDFLTDDARVYTVDSTEPIVGRREFQKYFGATLERTRRKVKVVHKDVQASGEQAVLSQTLEIDAGGVSSFVRQTVVWEETAQGWKMNHIHNATAGRAVATSGTLPNTAAGVRVLNERIATVAATVGVAQ